MRNATGKGLDTTTRRCVVCPCASSGTGTLKQSNTPELPFPPARDSKQAAVESESDSFCPEAAGLAAVNRVSSSCVRWPVRYLLQQILVYFVRLEAMDKHLAVIGITTFQSFLFTYCFVWIQNTHDSKHRFFERRPRSDNVSLHKVLQTCPYPSVPTEASQLFRKCETSLITVVRFNCFRVCFE